MNYPFSVYYRKTETVREMEPCILHDSKAKLVRPVIAESTKHYGGTAHSHLQTKGPAGAATNEHIRKAYTSKKVLLKSLQRGSAAA